MVLAASYSFDDMREIKMTETVLYRLYWLRHCVEGLESTDQLQAST